MTTTSPTSTAAPAANPSWLLTLHTTRAAFSLVWVALALTVGQGSWAVATVLLVIYPFWDALANTVDACRSGGLVHKANATQLVNAVVSTLTATAMAIAVGLSMQAVFTVWGVGDAEHVRFWAALAFLTFLQVTAAVLNSLPVPGLDGFGVLEPYLPNKVLRQVAPIAPYAVLLLFVLLWIPPVNQAFFSIIRWFLELLGIPGDYIVVGQSLFQFWLG